ncbi:STAS domain-containing protein [Ottowia sp. GY511]|uniref:Lipid asymmetry maintenance protein MlaB n=1 Tax=Ottowia flava TaxID=2675430 RepID=A0ABW4KXI7_9BURK|nr:STAS domain-containing protein [Ottowia sp. GY511]TXK31522.1 STAS domain-containing protein [Ottowia sp. GY511]
MLVLPAELTHVQANTCLDMLREAARSAQADLVLVDATALTRFDSSALAVLLECRREALHDGKGFAVRGLATRLRELAQLYGVAELLNEVPDPTGAVVSSH